MADFLRAAGDLDPHAIAAPDNRLYPAQRRRDGQNFSLPCRSDLGFGLFANRKCRRKLRLAHGTGLNLLACRSESEDIDAQNFVFEEVLGDFQLLGIFVGNRKSSIRAGKTMRVNEAIEVAHVGGLRKWHGAVGALCRFRWIVKRTCALARDSTGLPIVVLIEPAKPS